MSTYKKDHNSKILIRYYRKAFTGAEHMGAVLRCHILFNFHVSFVFPIIFCCLNLCHISPFISIKISSLAALSLDHSILHCLVLRFCCETCGWGKNLFCMIAYHFLVLVLRVWRWLYSQKSCLFFFLFFLHAGPRSQWGHVCGHNFASD